MTKYEARIRTRDGFRVERASGDFFSVWRKIDARLPDGERLMRLTKVDDED